jgi:hypothetical protein
MSREVTDPILLLRFVPGYFETNACGVYAAELDAAGPRGCWEVVLTGTLLACWQRCVMTYAPELIPCRGCANDLRQALDELYQARRKWAEERDTEPPR